MLDLGFLGQENDGGLDAELAKIEAQKKRVRNTSTLLWTGMGAGLTWIATKSTGWTALGGAAAGLLTWSAFEEPKVG